MRTAAKEPGPPAAESWGRAAVKAGLVLVAAVVAFAMLPDRLMAILTLRVPSRLRDVLVVAWVGASFVALSWGLVVLQRRGEKRP